MLAPVLIVLLTYLAARGALALARSIYHLAGTLPRRNADFGLE
jgi:hypothetical protein